MKLESLHELVRSEGGVPGEHRGSGESTLCIIGEAPGPDEVREGRPFIGKAGKLLSAMLEEAGITDYYITNRCLPPSTKVLTETLEWLPLGSLNEGDVLVGFDEFPRGGRGVNRQYCPAVITAKSTRKDVTYAITLEDGTVLRATAEHPWLVDGANGHYGYRWRRTDTLAPGQFMVKALPVWDQQDSYAAGWLSGFWDGEGNLTRANNGLTLRAAQVVGKTQELSALLLQKFGFKTGQYHNNYRQRGQTRQDTIHTYIKGGLAEAVRFLGSIRPQRLLQKANIYGLGFKAHKRLKIVRVEEFGEEEIVSIETSSHTFLAEGFASHNCKHFPGRDKDNKIKPPNKDDLERWAEVLKLELELVKPTTVLLLGVPACKLAFPGVWKLGEIVGTKKVIDGVEYIAAYHPSGFLRNQGKVSNTRNMNTQRRILKEIAGVEDVHYPYYLVPPRTVEGELVIDIETEGVDPRTAWMKETSTLGLGDFTATLDFAPSSLPPRPESAIFHNAMFDYPLLTRYDPAWLTVPEIHDTMVMAYVLGYEDLSLKGLCNQLFGVRVWTWSQAKAGECSPEQYNAQDVFLTRQLYNYLPQFIEGTAYDTDRSIIKILTRASIFGGYDIDQDRLNQSIADKTAERMKLEKVWARWFPGVSLGSWQQLLTVLPVTKTDKDTLRSLGTPEAELVLAWRAVNKALNTYLLPYRGRDKLSGLYRLTLAAGEDGDDEEGGTGTGRLSSHDPNMQNLDEVIERCLRAPKGYKICMPDYGQIELRAQADMSQDEKLATALREGRDLHQETADALGFTRMQGKTWNFARRYGAGASMLSRKFDISVDEAERLIKAEEAMYPAFTEWKAAHWNGVKAKGYSESPAPFRHRRKIHTFNEHQGFKQACNHPAQAHASYITKAAMAEIERRYGQEIEFVNSVHDSIHYFVPTPDAKKWEKKITEAMIEVGNEYLPFVGVEVDVQTNRYWEKK